MVRAATGAQRFLGTCEGASGTVGHRDSTICRSSLPIIEVYRWTLGRLARGPLTLARKLSGFMTLVDGDLLLVGIPGDPPIARAGQDIVVTAAGSADLANALSAEAEA